METNHRLWNDQQHALQIALADPISHPEWRSLFLTQHAQVNCGILAKYETWSFEDDVLKGMDEASLRCIPHNAEHSIAWILWHLARCEDLTMNMLVANVDQVLERQGWKVKLNSPINHTGNEISLEEITNFSQVIDFENLRAYRMAVGASTRQIVSQLTTDELGQKVRPERMDKVKALNVVLDPGILKYWSRRTIAGLLLMPPTRHCFVHLNEAERIKHTLRK